MVISWYRWLYQRINDYIKVSNNSWSPTGMSTLTHPLQHISGKDLNRRLRRSWRHCQYWRQNNHQPSLCWWHWWLCRWGRRTGKFSWASWQSFHSLRHGDQCREDRTDVKQHQWHRHKDQSEWTEAWDSRKLQIPELSYNWWGFQAWDTLQDSTDNSSIDKAETSLDWQEYFSQLQVTTDALPCHIHFLCACESWTLTAELQRRIQAMEMRCYRKILHILYWLRNHLWCPNDPRG